jgi:hypothetical protein
MLMSRKGGRRRLQGSSEMSEIRRRSAKIGGKAPRGCAAGKSASEHEADGAAAAAAAAATIETRAKKADEKDGDEHEHEPEHEE